ncbi:MAG: ketopantoate reductase family protein [Pseudomonadota bacterium]
MKILVLGAGGTGGYFGGRLAQSGADVTFLVRDKRAAQLAAHGLVIETTKERIVLAVKTVLAATVKPEYDVIFLACKAYDLAGSIAAILPAMHATTQVVPLLNGMSHLDDLDIAFGRERVMGGSCQIAAMLTPDGVVKNLAEPHAILWGARFGNTKQIELAAALAIEFAKTPVDWRVSDHVIQDMWEKLVFLSTLAGMTCLMRGSIGEILATGDGKTHTQRYLDSCIAVAIKEGFPPRPAIMDRFQAVMTSVGSSLTASMLRDLEAGNEVEADHIVGYMLEKARLYQLDDTLLSIAYAHLQTYQNRRKAKRL